MPIAGEPLPGYANPYGNPAYVTPYLGGTWGYGDGPDYGYGRYGGIWGHAGWGDLSGRTPAGFEGGKSHPGSPSPIERGGGGARIESSGGASAGGAAVASGGRR